MSIRLEDGRCAELTTRGFAVYDPATRSTGYATSLEDSDGTIYIPLVTKEGAKNIGLYLPTGVDEYHTEGELNKEV
ncbi:MAG: hypothetical protein H0X08_09510 [Blastocatellia bacterium]|nr:hypothetical protein [Blastocatellia bacterium]